MPDSLFWSPGSWCWWYWYCQNKDKSAQKAVLREMRILTRSLVARAAVDVHGYIFGMSTFGRCLNIPLKILSACRHLPLCGTSLVFVYRDLHWASYRPAQMRMLIPGTSLLWTLMLIWTVLRYFQKRFFVVHACEHITTFTQASTVSASLGCQTGIPWPVWSPLGARNACNPRSNHRQNGSWAAFVGPMVSWFHWLEHQFQEQAQRRQRCPAVFSYRQRYHQGSAHTLEKRKQCFIATQIIYVCLTFRMNMCPRVSIGTQNSTARVAEYKVQAFAIFSCLKKCQSSRTSCHTQGRLEIAIVNIGNAFLLASNGQYRKCQLCM